MQKNALKRSSYLHGISAPNIRCSAKCGQNGKRVTSCGVQDLLGEHSER